MTYQLADRITRLLQVRGCLVRMTHVDDDNPTDWTLKVRSRDGKIATFTSATTLEELNLFI